MEIAHQLPKVFPPGYETSCLWVVYAKKGGPIKFESGVDDPSSSGVTVVVAYHNRTTATTRSHNV